MLQLLRTDATNVDFQFLVRRLDHDLRVRDGEDQAFLAQLNQVAALRYVVLAYESGEPVGCGAFHELTPGVVELKRVFVQPAFRGQGVAQAVLAELEEWAQAEHYASYVLETGRNQPEAIRLYEKSGYRHVANFGKYLGVANSVCMQKDAPVGERLTTR